MAVVGIGQTRFGELWRSSLRDLFVEAAAEAIAGARADRVDAIVVGNMSGGQFVGQEHLGPLMADHLGMAGTPAIRVESACASGGAGGGGGPPRSLPRPPPRSGRGGWSATARRT